MKHLSYSLNVIFEAALNADLFLVFNKFVDIFQNVINLFFDKLVFYDIFNDKFNVFYINIWYFQLDLLFMEMKMILSLKTS